MSYPVEVLERALKSSKDHVYYIDEELKDMGKRIHERLDERTKELEMIEEIEQALKALR